MSGSRAARWLRPLHVVEDGLLALLLLALVLLASGQIGMRLLADTGVTWSEPLSRLLVMWLALLGALAATRERRHIAIDALPRLLPAAPARVLWVLAQLGAAAVSALLAWYALSLVQLELEAPSPAAAGVPVWVGMLVLPFGFGLMALRFALGALARPPWSNGGVVAPGVESGGEP